MMIKKIVGWVLLTLLLFAGCAELPMPLPPTPAEPAKPAKPAVQKPQVTVEVQPAGAKLFLVEASRSLESGQTLELEPGNYTINASEPTYVPQTVKFSLKPGEARTVSIKLVSNIGKLSVITEPAGAEISVNGDSKGKSPLALDLAQGEYSIEAKLANYRSQTVKQVVEAGGRLQTLAMALKPKPIGLKIQTQPSGAEIYVNGKLAGKTPLDTKLEVGSYELQTSLKGYRPQKHMLHTEAGDAASDFTYKLDPIIGSLTINTQPAGAQVYVDDQPKGQTPANMPLRLGSYRLRLSKRDYVDKIATLVLDESQIHKTLTEKLNLMTGAIKVSSKPAGATVSINGEAKGKTPVTLNLPMGGYQVEISKINYVNVNADVVLSETRPEVSLDQPLKLIRGSLTITSNPAGAEITLNGEPKGETPQTMVLPMGVYQVGLKKKDYVEIERELILNQADPDQSLNETMELAMGSLQVGSPQQAVAVSVNGEAMGQTPLTLALPMGRYLIKFSKQDYVSVVREVVLTETRPEQKLNELLKLARGRLIINSHPAGTKVSINGSPKGRTPLDMDLPMGEYKIQLKRKDYLEVTRQVALSESNPVRNLDEILQLVLGVIRVTSNTSMVDVTINGKPKGKTPLSLTLPMGSYRLELTKPKYVPVKRTVTLSEDEPVQAVEQDLLLAEGVLTINSNPEDAEVEINGELRGKTPLTLELPMGRHHITLTKPRYVSVRRNVVLTQAEPEQILNHNLELVYGTIQVDSPVSGVDVSVNGEPKGKTPLTLKLPLGKYKIDFKKYGYEDVSRTMMLSSGRFKQKVTADLVRLPGTLVIKTRQSGVQVLINGISRGTAPLRLTLPVGKYQLNFKKKQYLDQTKTINLTGPEPKEITASLLCACGSLTLETDDPNANIIFAGRIIGKGQAVLRTLKFGKYSAVAYLPTGKLTRKVGVAAFELKTQRGTVVRIPLTRHQRRFGGKWVDEKSAADDEQKRYLEQRINKPVALQLDLGPKTAPLWRGYKGLASILHAVMRVGDRVIFKQGANEWNIWKRSRQESEDFELAVNSFINNQPYTTPWLFDPVAVKKSQATGLAELALEMHRSRVRHPMLDLSLPQLPAQGLSLYHSPEDRNVFLLIQGGEGLKVSGKVPETRFGLAYLRYDPGWDRIDLTWSQKTQTHSDGLRRPLGTQGHQG